MKTFFVWDQAKCCCTLRRSLTVCRSSLGARARDGQRTAEGTLLQWRAQQGEGE